MGGVKSEQEDPHGYTVISSVMRSMGSGVGWACPPLGSLAPATAGARDRSHVATTDAGSMPAQHVPLEARVSHTWSFRMEGGEVYRRLPCTGSRRRHLTIGDGACIQRSAASGVGQQATSTGSCFRRFRAKADNDGATAETAGVLFRRPT